MEPSQNTVTDQPQANPVDPARRKKLLVWGLICLIGPSALLVLAFVLYAVFNFVFSSVTTTGDDLFASGTPPVLNILLFILGTLSVLTWLPGLIVGIILLVKRQG